MPLAPPIAYHRDERDPGNPIYQVAMYGCPWVDVHAEMFWDLYAPKRAANG